MWLCPDPVTLRQSVLTGLVALLGAGVAMRLHFPAPMLTGPAVVTTLTALWGVPMQVPARIRDAAFLILGIGIGTTMSQQATDALLRWPFAFVALFGALAVGMYLCQLVLRRGFGFDRRSAILAAAPGHLSFVIALSAAMNIDVTRVTIVQSVRLLALTLIVPVIAKTMGVDMRGLPLSEHGPMAWAVFAALVAASLGAGWLLIRFKVPAALLLGGMIVTAISHRVGWSTGDLAPPLAAAGFIALGAIIGTRFTGFGWRVFAGTFLAGVCATLIICAITVATAIPVAILLGLQFSSVLVAFAPGGMETMIALSAVLEASPGFITASHMVRLMILTVMIPAFLTGSSRVEALKQSRTDPG